MTIVWAIIILFVGVMLGYALSMIFRHVSSYAGIMKITRTDEKLIYSLELKEDPALLEYTSEVVFKVETSDESSVRT